MTLPGELVDILELGGETAVACINFLVQQLPLPEETIWQILCESAAHGDPEVQDLIRRHRHAGSTPAPKPCEKEAYTPEAWTPLDVIEIDIDEPVDLTKTTHGGGAYDPQSPTTSSPYPEAVNDNAPGLQSPLLNTTAADEGYETTAPSPNPTCPPTPQPDVIVIEDDNVEPAKQSSSIYSDFMGVVVTAFEELRRDLANINSPAALTAVDAVTDLILKSVDNSLTQIKRHKTKTRRVLNSKRAFYIVKRNGLIATLVRSVQNKDITVAALRTRLVQLLIKSEIVDQTSETLIIS